MKQLDIDVSPPSNITTFRLGLTNVTFDPDPSDLLPRPIWACKTVQWDLKSLFWQFEFDLDLQIRPMTLTHVTFDLDPCDPFLWPMWPLNIGPVTTDMITGHSEFWSSDNRQQTPDDRQKVMHKSPPCIGTGGLKYKKFGPHKIF